jgi:hypothetical protein
MNGCYQKLGLRQTIHALHIVSAEKAKVHGRDAFDRIREDAQILAIAHMPIALMIDRDTVFADVKRTTHLSNGFASKQRFDLALYQLPPGGLVIGFEHHRQVPPSSNQAVPSQTKEMVVKFPSTDGDVLRFTAPSPEPVANVLPDPPF